MNVRRFGAARVETGALLGGLIFDDRGHIMSPTYALRRAMTFSDRAELKRIAERSKMDGYRLASLIETLVASDLFQKR